MRPLLTLSARWSLVAIALVLAVGALGGVVRLLPWLLARDVPLLVALPFARVLVVRALEVSVLLGLPMGFGIAAALFVERGEARALGALGATPGRLVRGLVAPGLGAVLSMAALSRITEPPQSGRFAARFIDAGRSACAGPSRPSRVDLPLLSLSWLCFARGPRLAAAVPSLAGFWFSARDVRPTDELRAIEVDDLHLAGTIARVPLTLHSAVARLSGLPASEKARRVPAILRGLAVGLAALSTGIASAWAVVKGGIANPLVAAGGAAAAALVALAVFRALDAADVAAQFYVAAIAAGTLAGLLLLLSLAKLGFTSSRIARRGAR